MEKIIAYLQTHGRKREKKLMMQKEKGKLNDIFV